MEFELKQWKEKYDMLDEDMTNLEQTNEDFEINIAELLQKINNINSKLEEALDDKLRYETMANDRAQICEKLTHSNQKLMIKLASALCELERLFIAKHGDAGKEAQQEPTHIRASRRKIEDNTNNLSMKSMSKMSLVPSTSLNVGQIDTSEVSGHKDENDEHSHGAFGHSHANILAGKFKPK